MANIPLIINFIRTNIKTPMDIVRVVTDFLLKYRWLLIFSAVTFFGIIGISVMFRGGIGPPPRRTDLTVFLRAAEALQSGENIYLVTNARSWSYVYLRLLARLLMPFTILPLLANTVIWYLVSVSAVLGMIFLSSRMIEDRGLGMRAGVMASLLCIPPLLEAFTRAQPDTILTFLAVAVLYFYLNKRLVLAGLILAFAVSMKVSPMVILFVFFLVKKEWKVCAFFCLGIFLFVFALPSLLIGTEQNWFFVTEWNRIMSHAVSDLGHQSHIWRQLVNPFANDNLSLYAVVTRWSWPSESVMVANSNALIRWGIRVFGGFLLLILAFFSRKKTQETDKKQVVLEYSLFSVIAFFASPVASFHHYVMMYLMFLATFFYLDSLPKGSFAHRALSWGAFISFLFYLLGLASRKPFCLWGLPVLGLLAFWTVLVIFLACDPQKFIKKIDQNIK